jgi:hypothetical protein
MRRHSLVSPTCQTCACKNGLAMNQADPTTSEAIRQTEEERTKRAYLEQPDSEAEADDWSSAEEWKS